MSIGKAPKELTKWVTNAERCPDWRYCLGSLSKNGSTQSRLMSNALGLVVVYGSHQLTWVDLYKILLPTVANAQQPFATFELSMKTTHAWSDGSINEQESPFPNDQLNGSPTLYQLLQTMLIFRDAAHAERDLATANDLPWRSLRSGEFIEDDGDWSKTAFRLSVAWMDHAWQPCSMVISDRFSKVSPGGLKIDF